MNRINLLIFLVLMIFLLWILSNFHFNMLRENDSEIFSKETSNQIDSREIEVTVVYDNNRFKPGLKTSWGFSCVVKGTDKTILFDTGGDGSILLENMNSLAINPEEIDVIVLSHIHGDHVGGIMQFLEKNAQVTVYLPQSFPGNFKKSVLQHGASIVEVQDSIEIFRNVYSTGVMGFGIREQSLILQTQHGLIIITGCAHPGVVNIVKKAKDLLNDDVLLVMGGFHLTGSSQEKISRIVSDFRKLGVYYTGPCHCSGDSARQLFEMEYGENYISVGVGKTIFCSDLLK